MRAELESTSKGYDSAQIGRLASFIKSLFTGTSIPSTLAFFLTSPIFGCRNGKKAGDDFCKRDIGRARLLFRYAFSTPTQWAVHESRFSPMSEPYSWSVVRISSKHRWKNLSKNMYFLFPSLFPHTSVKVFDVSQAIEVIEINTLNTLKTLLAF